MSLAFVVILFAALLPRLADAGAVGICWGRNSWQPLPPDVIVNLLESNGITRLKLFSADKDILQALVGHNIEVSVMLSNEYLSLMSASQTQATTWVSNNVQPFIFPGGVNITMISVGNEPFLSSFNGQYDAVLVPALQNIQQALVSLNLASQVKVTVPLNADILASSYPPSSGRLRPDIAPQVAQIANVLQQVGAPFTVNIYPYLTLYQEKDANVITKSMALLDPHANAVFGQLGSPGGWNFVDPVSKLKYGNIFDGAYDAILAALAEIGYPNLPVEIGEVGWPSEGDNSTKGYATLENAQIFNNAILTHMLSGRGTPARPNQVISGYLFSLTDEDRKSTDAGAFERHWGIFRSNGQPKYNVDFTGQQPYVQQAAAVAGGSDEKNLTAAKGIPFLPAQWCIAKPSMSQEQLAQAIGYACGDGFASDCTPTLPGGSCYFKGNLTKLVNYAFNSFYQLNNQSAETCQFSGVGTVVTTDPSEGDCVFELGISQTPKSAARVVCQAWMFVFLCWAGQYLLAQVF